MNGQSYTSPPPTSPRHNHEVNSNTPMYNSQINEANHANHPHKFGHSVFGVEKAWKPHGVVVSPKRPPGLASPRQMPAFLEGKNSMKASLVMDQHSKNPQSPTQQKTIKRMPRMSEHLMPEFHSPSHSNGTKIPPFLQKTANSKTDEESVEEPEEQDLFLTGSSSAKTLESNKEKVSTMRKSSFDPTAVWLKQSLNRRKERIIGIDDFEEIKSLGGGKYGKVYLAREKKTNFICALKIIEKSLLKEEEITEQFIRELKIQMFLNHPNIVKLYGYFHDHTNFYIILEVGTSGQLLKQLKKSQSMPEAKVATLMRQICQAVNELHSNQIIHRDLKPENIVMTDNVVKLCDFGWSVHMDKNLRTTFCGTPLYVCPEILRGKDYDEKIDIWSLGVMMYEMLVGENPFKITKEEELIKIVKDAVVIPSYVELSPEAKHFLDCCLQKNPEQRCNIRELLNHQFFKKYPEKNDKKMGL